MAYAVSNVFADGAVAVAADVIQNTDEARTYVNEGIVVGDIDAGAIDTEHLQRPELYGSPINGQIGPYQSIWYDRHGMNRSAVKIGHILSATGYDTPWWELGAQRDRESVFVQSIGKDKSAPVPGMSRRVRFRTSGKALVTAEWQAFLMYNNDTGGGVPAYEYPGSSGWPSGSDGGYFIHRAKRVRAPGESTSPPYVGGYGAGGKRHIYPQLNVNGGDGVFSPALMNFRSWMWFTVPSAGWFDFYLEYNYTGFKSLSGKSGLIQLILGERNFVVEGFFD